MRLRAPAAAVALLALAACGPSSSSQPAPPAAWHVVEVTTGGRDSVRYAAVSCAARTFCIAAGTRIHALAAHAALARFDGTGWRPVAPNADTAGSLSTISCPSETFCFAAGNVLNGSQTRPLVALWDGRRWRTSTLPGGGALSGVSCVPDGFCAAVGSTRTASPSPLVEVWRRDAWTRAALPQVRGGSLAAVSCTSPSFCVAVGQRSAGTGSRTLALVWDGTRWVVEQTPSVTAVSELAGVACVSSDWCIAVGDHLHGVGSQPLVVRRESTWSMRPSPSRGVISGFASVSCTSTTVCVAVGAQRDGAANATFVAGWDGEQWTLATTPNPSATNTLTGASCVEDERVHCVVVGAAGRASGISTEPLVLRGDRGP